ncbi:hypothetical protein H6G64_19270 [Calothrix sp. FACHB-156]|nr:hypothetical protein [Nostoc linckia FACHB-104]MBD2339116.1 hypothetical protein [Calothrix sp. FACHB-156]
MKISLIYSLSPSTTVRKSKVVFSQRARLRQEKFAQVGIPAHVTFVFSTRGCANDTLRVACFSAGVRKSQKSKGE